MNVPQQLVVTTVGSALGAKRPFEGCDERHLPQRRLVFDGHVQ